MYRYVMMLSSSHKDCSACSTKVEAWMCDQVNTAMIFLQQNWSHAGCKTKPEISTTNIPRDKKIILKLMVQLLMHGNISTQ